MATIKEKFEQHFSTDNLTKIFYEHIQNTGATGIDNLTPTSFEKQINQHIEVISRKVHAGTYRFSKYKLKLISKGRNKKPREISIPTVRDRIALRALCNFLSEIYEDTISFPLPQTVIKAVKEDLHNGTYDTCIKLDVKNFYPSIKHNELRKRIGKKIRHEHIKDLIISAVKTATVDQNGGTGSPTEKGIPQGLSISNILAALYLINLDKKYNDLKECRYARYVDDILILCQQNDSSTLSEHIVNDFKRLGLDVYHPEKRPDKSTKGPISDGFSYLGYLFTERSVSVKQSSINKLRSSIAAIFTNYKYSSNKSDSFLLWRLNLRITGCVFEKKRKGWLFFFSEITDESMLYDLDRYVEYLTKRFKTNITPKKFSRAHQTILHRKHKNNYIPNYDNYNTDDMRNILEHSFGYTTTHMSDEKIEKEFKKKIGKQARELLTDIQAVS